jgi:hypothetical protein
MYVSHIRARRAYFKHNYRPLLEIAGGLMGICIRMSYYLFDEFSPTHRELCMNELEESKATWTDIQRGHMKVLKFFEWIGRHVARDVAQPEWKLAHEAYEMEGVEYPLTREKLEQTKTNILGRIDRESQRINELSRNIKLKGQGFREYRAEVERAVIRILGKESATDRLDEPLEYFLSEQFYGNFPCLEMWVSGIPAYGKDDIPIEGVLDDDFIGYYYAYKQYPSMLITDAKKWPEFLGDLAEGRKELTPKIVFERRFKMKMKAVEDGLRIIRERVSQYSIATWFDVTEFDCEETKKGFLTAENHEKQILQNLPIVVRMPDEEILTKFFK